MAAVVHFNLLMEYIFKDHKLWSLLNSYSEKSQKLSNNCCVIKSIQLQSAGSGEKESIFTMQVCANAFSLVATVKIAK